MCVKRESASVKIQWVQHKKGQTKKTIGCLQRKTQARVLVSYRFHSTIPESERFDHIRENYKVFNFKLSAIEMGTLGDLSYCRRFILFVESVICGFRSVESFRAMGNKDCPF